MGWGVKFYRAKHVPTHNAAFQALLGAGGQVSDHSVNIILS